MTRSASGVLVLGLRKRFGDTVALDGLELEARPGEILGIAGPNGAGKSTMVRILAGEETPDEGSITINGEPWSHHLGGHRIAVVHQEPQIFPNLTVAENVQVGREHMRRGRPTPTFEEKTLLAELEVSGLMDVPLQELPLAVHQKTEIARALCRHADVFLFDEPNSALTEEESDELFTRMHAMADAGHVVILVSHRLAELAAHSDRVCVIKDGRLHLTLEGADVKPERIARELVVSARGPAKADRRSGLDDAAPLLSIAGWTHHGHRFQDVEFSLNRGEIVAVIGTEGSGGREFVRSIAGIEHVRGQISLADGRTGEEALAAATFVGADRQDSLFTNLTVEENLVVRQYAALKGPLGWRRRGVARQIAESARKEFMVKTQDLDTPIRSLSGGNQQKVAIASALATQPTIAVLEEPTRGVDIGSKAEIYELLREFAARGRAVLLYCTEESEVFDAADRAVVIARGRVVGSADMHAFTDAESLAEHLTSLTAVSQPRLAAAG